MTFNTDHRTDYLEIKDQINQLKKRIENVSWYGEAMGKKTELFCEIMQKYLLILKKESWKAEMHRTKNR